MRLIPVLLLLITDLPAQRICFVGDLENSTNEIRPYTARDIPDLSGKCLLIDLYCDYYTLEDFSFDQDSVREWMRMQWDSVKVLYDSAGVKINISSYNIPDGPMWADTTPFLTMLTLFYEFGIQVDDTGPGHFAHFMTTKNFGGGIAWVGTFCSRRRPRYNASGELITYSWNYSVSTSLDKDLKPIDDYQWNYNVLAHEMGHNLGLSHTHSCVWGPAMDQKIDDCQGAQGCSTIQPVDEGTIMSYCHLTSVGIDLRVKNFGTLPTERMAVNIDGCPNFDYLDNTLTLTGLISGDYNANKIILDRGGSQFTTKLRSATDVEIGMPSELNEKFVVYSNMEFCR